MQEATCAVLSVCLSVSWFHDKISRKDAEKLLVELNNQPGTFIVRESETYAGQQQHLHGGPIKTALFMVALCNRADHYIFMLWFVLLFFLA